MHGKFGHTSKEKPMLFFYRFHIYQSLASLCDFKFWKKTFLDMLLIDLKVMMMNSSELKLLYLTYIYLKFLKLSARFLKQLKPTMMINVRNVFPFCFVFFYSKVYLVKKKSFYCDKINYNGKYIWCQVLKESQTMSFRLPNEK